MATQAAFLFVYAVTSAEQYEAERGSARAQPARRHRAQSRTTFVYGIKLNAECAVANILKGRGRAVPAGTHAFHRTLTTDCWGVHDGPRQRVITSTVTTAMSAHRGKAEIPPQGRDFR